MSSEEYDCEAIYNEFVASSPTPLSDTQTDLYCVFQLFFMAVTITGNSLVIVSIFKFPYLRKRQNVHIAVLALSDMSLAILVMPLHTYEQWNRKFDLPQWVCDFRNIIDAILTYTSILNLCILCVERYLAVCRPFTYQKITPCITTCTAILSWVLPLTSMIAYIASGMNVIGLEDYNFCLLKADVCPFLQTKWSVYVQSVYVAVIPMTLILILYVKIFQKAKEHARAIRSLTVTEDDKKKRKAFTGNTKAARTLSIVIGVFYFCWLPLMLATLVDSSTEYKVVPPIIIFLFVWLAYLNSLMNPFLYYMFSQDFKTAFKQFFRCKPTAVENITSTTNP